MATLFLDSSALFRRYFAAESGSRRVRAVCAPAMRNTLFVARLAPLEIASSLQRRVRDGTLSSTARRDRWREFQIDLVDQYAVVELTDDVFATAGQLVERYPLRTLDALHVACAIQIGPRQARARLQFWTADRQQAAAAQSEGLDVELVG